MVVVFPVRRKLAGLSGEKSCLYVSLNLFIPTGLKLKRGDEFSATKKKKNN